MVEIRRNEKKVNGIYDMPMKEIKAIETLTGKKINLNPNILTLMGKKGGVA